MRKVVLAFGSSVVILRVTSRLFLASLGSRRRYTPKSKIAEAALAAAMERDRSEGGMAGKGGGG